MPDYSSGFKMNLESIEMVVTRESYESLKEGDKIEAYCMKVDGNYACKPSTTIKARLN
jgi:Cu/Ag efflux protein CusF